MSDLVKPAPPWEPWNPSHSAIRPKCPGCQGTGRITTLAGIASCDVCAEQRAIDTAAVNRMRMEGRDPIDYAKVAEAHAAFQQGKTLSEEDVIVSGKAWAHAWSVAGGAKPNPKFPEEVAVLKTAEALVEVPAVVARTARILDITAAQYHRDPIDPTTPSLSNSIASTIVLDAPYIAWLAHPRLGNMPTAPTKSMEAGTILHSMVLEAGRGIAPLPFDNWRTNESKAARSDARANGLLPMLAREYEPLMAVAEDIRYSLEDAGMALRGKSEVVVTWHEESRRGPVLCRAMMDHLIIDEQSAEIIDLKITASADLKTCVRHIYEYGYDCQNASYVSAIEKLYPHLAGRIRFRFAFAQIMQPGSPRRILLTPVELNGEFQALGRERWKRGVETWAHCLKTDQWPGYVPDGQIERVAPAPWMLTGEMDQQRAAAAEESDEDEDE